MNYKDEIKAVAFDYDGTLIDFQYRTYEPTIDALERLCASRYKVALMSGRPSFLAKKSFEKDFPGLKLDYVFGCNGSEVYDAQKDETKLLHPVSAFDIRRLGALFEDAPFLYLGIYDGEKFLVNHRIDSEELIEWMNARWLTPIEFDYQTNDVPRSKVLVLNEKKDRDREIEYIRKLDLSDLNGFYSSPYCFEIAPKGISKATSVSYLASELNCNEKQILAFGDNDNDMEMLMCATGVIMENARKELKDRIPLHTDRVDKLGIYDFLSRNGLI